MPLSNKESHINTLIKLLRTNNKKTSRVGIISASGTKRAIAPITMNAANPATMFSKTKLSKLKNTSKYPVTNMDDNEPFVAEDVSKIVKETIEAVLNGSLYQIEKVNIWSASVSEQCLNQLSKLKKNFKYVVTCSIMQKTGSGLHTASSCYWDSATDGTCTVRWENDYMFCIVTVFGLAI